MAREPSYPADAPVGTPPEEVTGGDSKSGESGRSRKIAAGVAVGIGSAAIVAALLYARSGKAKKK